MLLVGGGEDGLAQWLAARRSLAPRPPAGVAGAPPRSDPRRHQGANRRLWDLPEIPVKALPMALEIDDRIADELPGTMEGDVSSALHLMELHAARGEQLGRRQQMLLLRRSTQGDDRRMFDEEQQVLLERPADPSASGGALKLQSFRVRHGAQLADGKPGHVRRESSVRASRGEPRRWPRTAWGAREWRRRRWHRCP